jgi:hypothetical protein
MARLRREIAAAQTVIAGIAGRPPVFSRTPGFRSPLLDPCWQSSELHYVSWTTRL